MPPQSVIQVLPPTFLRDHDIEEVEAADEAVRRAVQTRKSTIETIKQVAAQVDLVSQGAKRSAVAGGAVAMLGTTLTIIGGGVVFATAGAAAAPALAGYMLWTGTGVGLLGGVARGYSSYASEKEQSALMDRLEVVIQKDVEANTELQIRLNALQRPAFEDVKFRLMSNLLNPAISGANAFAHVFGGLALAAAISPALPVFEEHILDEDLRKLLGPAMIVFLAKLVESVKVTVKAGASISDDMALGAVTSLVEGPTKKLAFNAAKEVAEATIVKGGDETAKALAAVAAEKAAEQALAQVAKKAAKVATKEASKTVARKAAESAAAQAAKKAAEEAAEMAVEAAAKKAAEAALKNAAQVSARKAAEQAAAQAAKKAAVTASKKASKAVAAKVAEAAAAKEAAKVAVEAAAEKAAQSAAQNVLKTVGRISGSLTVGFGALFLAWDGYNMYQDCNRESLGDALRQLAKSFEDAGARTKSIC